MLVDRPACVTTLTALLFVRTRGWGESTKASMTHANRHTVEVDSPTIRVAPLEDAADQYDARLVSQMAAGDVESLATLFDRLGPMAFGLALRLSNDRGSAELAVERALLTAWRRAGDFDPAGGSAKAWLCEIVRRTAVQLAQGNRGAAVATSQSIGDVRPTRPVAAPGVLDGADPEKIRTAMAALPDAERSALESAYFDGLTQAEIAAKTHVTVDTVRARLRSGLVGLRMALIEDDADDRP